MSCPPSTLPPGQVPQAAPHLSLELLADGGVLADVTVQADHVALQLRWGHRGEICLFIQKYINVLGRMMEEYEQRTW